MKETAHKAAGSTSPIVDTGRGVDIEEEEIRFLIVLEELEGSTTTLGHEAFI